MKVLITDDEALARERLRRLLDDVGGVELVGEAANGSEALALSERLHPDLVLMDIRMPGLDGIETALHLSTAERPPAVVFTTAYGDHALAAFDANAVDYLLKPIRRERLAQALARAAVVRRAQLQAVRAENAAARTHICARSAGALRLIPLDEVVYFRADQKYVAVRHLHGSVLIDEALATLEQEFAGRFLRVHRNTLVATAFIDGLRKSASGACELVLRGIDDRPEVSRRHAAALKALLAGQP
jgi:two-component system response regulator AlgR